MPVAKPFPGAEAFLPASPTLPALRAAVPACRGCPLYQGATQAVFGEGSPDARLVLVGEVPGDAEDRAGHPFVGPAGQLLDDALAAAGIARGDVYITNAVKHFKFEPRGKRRIHKTPTRYEVRACKPWLEAELAALAPEIVVVLGATAAQALLGPSFRVTRSRGQPIACGFARRCAVATVHPASVLRAPDDDARAEARARFFADLAGVGALLR